MAPFLFNMVDESLTKTVLLNGLFCDLAPSLVDNNVDILQYADDICHDTKDVLCLSHT
jgi:hypothetical protein